ncbi:glutamate 5-kinase [Tistrella mobilis]|uniref:glutamate 5-kinase n=1 Tax=Tistrella mobilis TaxID=171437 RepID=UPI003558975B
MTIAGTDLADTPAAAGLRAAKRVVIKVGSALLVDEATGRLRDTWLQSLADDIARMRARGQEVIVVSSGAIALGRRLLGLGQGVLRLEEKQAAAATGQIRLAHAYETVLGPHGIQVAQVLLTLEDSEARRRYLNARATLGTLLKLGAVPVINENDTVATAEIRFGDNDRLSARVAEMASADLLLLLSDIDGLYTADPGVDPTARHIPRVPRLTPRILAMGGGSRSAVGTGGMATKLAAARVAGAAGCAMVIALGRHVGPVSAVEAGGRATWFDPETTPHTARKRWIGGRLSPRGTLTVDEGAVKALARGGSLLPAGIRLVTGRFQRGDAVAVVDPAGREIARGLAAYGDADARAIAGHRSAEIEQILGFRGRDEMIHRDDLVFHGGDMPATTGDDTEEAQAS